jgi:hypothetical protein
VQLEWFSRDTKNDGDPVKIHYLFDPSTQLCYATLTEPNNGSILFVTDIRVAGYDRSYLTLQAAKDYCEFVAHEYEVKQCEELASKLEAAEFVRVKEVVE